MIRIDTKITVKIHSKEFPLILEFRDDELYLVFKETKLYKDAFEKGIFAEKVRDAIILAVSVRKDIKDNLMLSEVVAEIELEYNSEEESVIIPCIAIPCLDIIIDLRKIK